MLGCWRDVRARRRRQRRRSGARRSELAGCCSCCSSPRRSTRRLLQAGAPLLAAGCCHTIAAAASLVPGGVLTAGGLLHCRLAPRPSLPALLHCWTAPWAGRKTAHLCDPRHHAAAAAAAGRRCCAEDCCGRQAATAAAGHGRRLRLAGERHSLVAEGCATPNCCRASSLSARGDADRLWVWQPRPAGRHTVRAAGWPAAAARPHCRPLL